VFRGLGWPGAAAGGGGGFGDFGEKSPSTGGARGGAVWGKKRAGSRGLYRGRARTPRMLGRRRSTGPVRVRVEMRSPGRPRLEVEEDADAWGERGGAGRVCVLGWSLGVFI
jgi:hypothetical protein